MDHAALLFPQCSKRVIGAGQAPYRPVLTYLERSAVPFALYLSDEV